jgi:hypothetical protein
MARTGVLPVLGWIVSALYAGNILLGGGRIRAYCVSSLNYELNENSAIVSYLNVFGSSLYLVERESDGTVGIHNYTYKAWELTSNKNNFVSYFEDELQGYL